MTSLQTSNIFAALGAAKGGKKKSGKSKEDGGEKKKKQSKAEEKSQLEAAIFSGLPSVSNWADELDEEDDFGGGLGALPDGWSAVRLVISAAAPDTLPITFRNVLYALLRGSGVRLNAFSLAMHPRQCLASSSPRAVSNAMQTLFRIPCHQHQCVQSTLYPRHLA